MSMTICALVRLVLIVHGNTRALSNSDEAFNQWHNYHRSSHAIDRLTFLDELQISSIQTFDHEGMSRE